MSITLLQIEPGSLLAAAPSMYVTIPQLLAVAFIVGGVLMLAWAFRRGSAPAATRRRPVAARPEPEPVREYMADARELADLLADRLDRQAQRLERLLAEADEKVRKLERLTSEGTRPMARSEADPLNTQVYTLADEGLPPVEIARQLQQHTGKVELILALRRR